MNITKELIKALKECAGALEDEISAAGDDDHPMMKAHRKVAERARAVIAKAEATPSEGVAS